MVKLFYANLNLGHQQPRNREDCVWSLVCGQQVFFSLDRIAHILQSPSTGINLGDIDCVVGRRDRISHLFMGDDMPQLRSKFLRPQARIMHKTLMRSIHPGSGSYEQIYPENFQSLYAIWGGIQVNWTRLILNEFLTIHNRPMHMLYYGEYIMRLLLDVEIRVPDSDYSTPGMINIRTISLMQLPPRPPFFESLEEWHAKKSQRQSQGPIIREAQGPVIREHEPNDEMRIPSSDLSMRQSLDILSKNKLILNSNLKKVDKKLDKVKGFFSTLWNAISCSSSSETYAPGKRLAPRFTWSTSEEPTSSDTSGNDGTQQGASSHRP